MEYRVAVVIQPKNSTDLAGTLVFGEEIKGLGVTLCMVTPEHDVIPFADNDQPKIDRKIKNIITEGDLTKEGNEYIHNTPELPKFDLSGDAAIMIIKKGGESFVHNDIEKYVDTLNNIGNDIEPTVMHTKYKGVDRIQIPYLTDELVFWRMKTNIDGETKYHSLEEQIKYLLNIVCKEYTADTDRFISLINKFYACGCDPKVLGWHKANLDQINKDDKILRLFGELSERRHHIENIEDILNGLKDDITEGCYIQQLNLDRGGDRFVNLKIYSNFKFPRVRGIILGYDGANLCVGRFDCTSSSGVPLYVAVDTWIGKRDNPPILIAPADSSYTITADTRARFYMITDIPECVYEVLDDRRLTLEEAMNIPLSTQFNGDFIKNTKQHILYNIGEDSVIAQEISIVGELEEDLLEPYLTAFRVSHRLPQLINDVDDEMMYIICSVSNINSDQLMRIVIRDNYNNRNIILDRTMSYSEYRAMAGGYTFRYPNVYNNGIDYNVEVSFVKRDGSIIQNTRVYNLRTSVVRSDKAGILSEDLEFARNEIHLRKYNDDVYEAGTIVSATVTNGNGSIIYNGNVTSKAEDVSRRYISLEMPTNLEGNVNITLEIKEPNKFQSMKQTLDIDMDKILPNNYYDITNISVENGGIYLNRIILNRLLLQDKTYYSGTWYDSLNKIYSEHPANMLLKYNSGAPKIEVTTKIKGINNLELFEWTDTYNRTLEDINNRGIVRDGNALLDIDNNTKPYNIYFDKILRAGNFSDDSINEFRGVTSDLITAFGVKYEITIKTYDTFDKLRKTTTYLHNSPINKKITTSALDIDEIFDNIFIYNATEDNMIQGIKLAPGTNYSGMEFMLMIDSEDNAPSKDTILCKFYINEHGQVTKVSDINYDDISRDGDKYVLFTDSQIQDIASKQNIVLWIRPRDNSNSLFYNWYDENGVNNTFLRIDKTINRAVTKAPGVTNINIRANITDVIDYINDEFIEVRFNHNIGKNKANNYNLKIDLVDSDNNIIESVEKSIANWDEISRTYRFEGAKYTKDTNKFTAKITVTHTSDPNFDSSNKYKEASVTVLRTKQPWFSNVSLGKLPLNNLDIRLAEGTSYPIDTKFWVRIEDNDDNILFEYNGAVEIVDIINGYHRIYIPKKPEGLFTLSVIAKELGKYQSLIYRTSAEFVLNNMKYGSIYYDETKELSVFRYTPGEKLGEEVATHIFNLIRRTEPGRSIVKIRVKNNDGGTDYTTLEQLKDAIIPDESNIYITLETIPANEYRYINVYFNGNKAGKIVALGGNVSNTDWNNWYNDYQWVYDLSSMNNGFDVTEHDPTTDDIVATKHVNSIADMFSTSFDLSKVKKIRLNNIPPREVWKDIKLKIKDTSIADFDTQTKRSTEYNDGIYTYKRPNNRANTPADFNTFINFIKTSVTINDPVRYILTSITSEGNIVWSADESFDMNKWLNGDFDNKELIINVEVVNKIRFNADFVFSQNTSLNYSKNVVIRKQVGDKIDGTEIDALFSKLIADYCDIKSGSRILNNVRGGYRIKMFYNNNPISADYKLDCLFNRLTGKTVVDVYNEIYTSKPAIDGFTLDQNTYNIRVEVTFDDITIANPSLRNHTIVNVRLTNGKANATSGYFKNLSKVYVYKNDRLEPISGNDLYREVYLYVPNGGSLFDLLDISKATVDTGYNVSSYDITWAGKSLNNAETNWNNEYYKRPIAYVDKNIRVLNIAYSNVLRAPVIQTIKFTRDYGEPVRFSKDNTPGSTVCVTMPIQITDDSDTYKDHIAEIILSTPELRNSIIGLNSGDIVDIINKNTIGLINKENIWSVLDYPTVIPKFINMNLEFEFDRDYTDYIGKSYYSGKDVNDDIILSDINTIKDKSIDLLNSNAGCPTTYGIFKSTNITTYTEYNHIFTDLIRVNTETAKVVIPLFSDVGSNIDITNIPNITIADYIVAYNLYMQISKHSTSYDMYYNTDYQVIKSTIVKKFEEAVYNHKTLSISNISRFYNIFLEAKKLRKKIQAIDPINIMLTPYRYNENLEIIREDYPIISSRFNIKKEFVVINGRRVALELKEENSLYGDLYDLSNTVTNAKKKKDTFIDYLYTKRSKYYNRVDKYPNDDGLNKYTSAIIQEPYMFTNRIYFPHSQSEISQIIYKNNQVPYLSDFSNITGDGMIDMYDYNNITDFPELNGNNPFGILVNDPLYTTKGREVFDPLDQYCDISNGIYFPIPIKRITDESGRDYSEIVDSSDSIEMIVRIEDFYGDKDYFDIPVTRSATWYSSLDLPNILYDGKHMLKYDLSLHSDLLRQVSIAGHTALARISLIPRKISEINMENTNISSFRYSNNISKVVTTELETKSNLDPDFKYEQYVGLKIGTRVGAGGNAINTMSNYSDEVQALTIDPIKNYPVRGMMQSILKNSLPSAYNSDGIMILEVNINVITSLVKIDPFPIKYYILLNTNIVQPNLNNYYNDEGSWSNSLEFKVVPKEDNPFELEYKAGTIFTGGFYTDKNLLFKTDSKTFTIKFSKRHLANAVDSRGGYHYVPTEVVSSTTNRYGDTIPKFIYMKEIDNTGAEMYGFVYNKNSDINKADGFDASAVNTEELKKYQSAGFAIYFPLDDLNRSLWAKNWFRRFHIVIKNEDNSTSYIFDSTLATGRIHKHRAGLRANRDDAEPILLISKNNSERYVFIYTNKIEGYNNSWIFSPMDISNYMNPIENSILTVNDIENTSVVFPFDIYSLYNSSYYIDSKSNSKYKYFILAMLMRQIVYMFTGFYNKNYTQDQVKNIIANAVVEAKTTKSLDLLASIGLSNNLRNNVNPNVFSAARFDTFWNKYSDLFSKVLDADNSEDKNILIGYTGDAKLFNTKARDNRYFRSSTTSSTRQNEHGVDIINDWLDGLDGGARTSIDKNATKRIVLSPDLDTPFNATASSPNILAKTKIGNTIRLLVEANALHFLYKSVDYKPSSMITIMQPTSGFLGKYITIIDIELQNTNSVVAFGTWVDGYDLSVPTYIRWNDSNYITESEFDNKVSQHSVVNNLVIGWYKPGIDRDFLVYEKNAKKSGLYLKVHSMFTQQNDTTNINKSEEFYYPLFRTITKHVNRKLDLIYRNEVLHARTTDCAEVVLPNGATFIFNPLLDYLLSILDTTSESKLHRIY